MNGQPLISIVSPVYKAEFIVHELVKRIVEETSKITSDFEIVLVEDCGPDHSWARIAEEAAADTRVKGIRLSRNFGQQYAITAGLDAARGDYVVVMDCDLQDNPKYIADLYTKALEGNDIVYTKKNERKHSAIKNLLAGFFFWVFNFLTNNQRADSKTGAFSMLSRKAVNAFRSVKEYHRHYLMILRSIGFKSDHIVVIHEERFEGKTSYSLAKLISLAINGIASQSDKLLRLSISLGFALFFISILWSSYLIYLYFSYNIPAGYTSIMVMLLLSTGLIMMSIGITGLYISKIFDQVKSKPLYIIDKTINV